MRFVVGLLSGLLGMLAGWFGLALVVIAVSAPDHDGGTAMGAFFTIGPIGGLLGFAAGLWVFAAIGVVRRPAASSDGSPTVPGRPRTSRRFAVAVVALSAGLAWWAWDGLIRSPYLSHGFMTLDLRFRLPPGMAMPAETAVVGVVVEEGEERALTGFPAEWRSRDGDRPVIAATATLSRRTGRRIVRLRLPGSDERIWRLDLAADPDPEPEATPWRPPSGAAPPEIELSLRLTADR